MELRLDQSLLHGSFHGSFPLGLNLNNSPKEVKCLTKGLRAMLPPEVLAGDSLKTITGTKVKILDTVLYTVGQEPVSGCRMQEY